MELKNIQIIKKICNGILNHKQDNPGPIYGPTLTGNLSGASMSMIHKIITGKMPMLPNASYVMSDFRDIAKIHVLALDNNKR